MISLREFAYEIRQRIDEGRTSEAIPLAQYLLRRHPRYLRGYQLLAEAALEQGNLTDAIEIFSRVLSADPESFAAHAGLASAYTEQNELDNALWHMTRAFESEPGMKAVRDQIRYLYEQRDGRAPGRLHLNSAALARSYLRNGAYDAAVEDLNHELRAEPERIDLRIALAEAYWFADQPQESAQIAFNVLEELPLALKPHLILANFYYHAGEMAQAETHLRIAQDLDPENDVAIALFGEGAPFRAIATPIDEPDNIHKGTAPLSTENQLPEWLRDLSLFSAPEARTDGVDWDAIIAYEDDWRTQLAGATRDELAAYKPNWRANLRLATVRALRERGIVYPTPAPVVAPDLIEASPVVAEVEPMEATAALAEVAEAVPTDEVWRTTLYAETIVAFDDLDSALAPMTGEMPSGEVVEVPTPEWHATLRYATEEVLAAYQPDQTDDLALADDPTVDLPILVFPPADTSAWVRDLRAASDTLVVPSAPSDVFTADLLAEPLTEIEALFTATERIPTDPVSETAPITVPVARVTMSDVGTVPRQRLFGRWIPTLRVATEIWLAMQRRTTGRRGTGTLVPPAPAPVAERDPDPIKIAPEPPVVALPVAEPEPAALVEPAAPEPQSDAPLVVETDTTIQEPVLRTAEAPEAAVPEFNTEAELVSVEEVGVSDDVPSAAESTPLTPLQTARQQWQAGELKAAVGQYQILFYEESVPDNDLSAALAEWVAADTAPALVYQLLGDVYRRMGRMPEAVAHYREAINRM